MKIRIAMTKTSMTPIEIIRCDDLMVYVEEGYGGKHISFFPPYHFFKKYLEGDKDEAFQSYVRWYEDQVKKYYNTPKSLGGMKFGSLYKLIEKRHQNNNIVLDAGFTNLDDKILKNSIEERVLQRFTLLETIQQEGFKETDDNLYGIEKNNYIYLRGGHHRCAITFLLGYKTLPIKVLRE